MSQVAGHSACHVTPEIDLVIYSVAVGPENVELRRAAELGIPTLTYAQMLGRLMAGKQGLAVAGTHGKSTTTAMAACVLVAAGLDPTVVCGATPLGAPSGDGCPDFCVNQGGQSHFRGEASRRCPKIGTVPSGGRCGRGDLVLVEACEYRGNFLHLQPRYAAILGIEPDHFDCYDSLDELEQAFAQFAALLPRDGLLGGPPRLPGDPPSGRRRGAAAWKPSASQPQADWAARNLDRPSRPLPL